MTSSNHQGRSDTAGQSPTGQSDSPKATVDDGYVLLEAWVDAPMVLVRVLDYKPPPGAHNWTRREITVDVSRDRADQFARDLLARVAESFGETS